MVNQSIEYFYCIASYRILSFFFYLTAYRIISYCTILYHIASYCIILYRTVLYGIAWYGIVSHRIAQSNTCMTPGADDGQVCSPPDYPPQKLKSKKKKKKNSLNKCLAADFIAGNEANSMRSLLTQHPRPPFPWFTAQ